MNVIAQEFGEVFPDYVQKSGEKLPDGSEILQVDPYPLTIYTAAAVQELHEHLSRRTPKSRAARREETGSGELEARLSRLEKALADLKLERDGG